MTNNYDDEQRRRTTTTTNNDYDEQGRPARQMTSIARILVVPGEGGGRGAKQGKGAWAWVCSQARPGQAKANGAPARAATRVEVQRRTRDARHLAPGRRQSADERTFGLPTFCTSYFVPSAGSAFLHRDACSRSARGAARRTPFLHCGGTTLVAVTSNRPLPCHASWSRTSSRL
jgi:hypothetical protein